VQGGGHGGSHPHLAHNFLQACLGRQAPLGPNAPTSANWTDGRHLVPTNPP